MSRIGIGLCLLALTGCQAGALSGATCERRSDCLAPLTCAYGHCRSECVSSRDCAPGLRCIDDGSGGACTLLAEEHCTATTCPAPLACVDDRCRTQCATDADCRAGTCASGTCLEPVERPPLVAPSQRTPGACSPGALAPALIEAILGQAPPGAGLERIVPGRLAAYDAPRDGMAFQTPQLGLAARRSATDGEIWLGLMHDGVDGGGRYERHVLLYTVPIDDLARVNDPSAIFPAFNVVQTRWLDVGVDGDIFLALATLEAPDTTGTSAWMIESPPTGASLIRGIRAGSPPSDQTARSRIVGGRSSFDADASEGWPVFYVFREDSMGTPTLGSVNRNLDPPPNYVSTPTTSTLPEAPIDTGAGEGPLWIGRRPTGELAIWDQRRQDMLSPPTVRPPTTLAASATGAPAATTLGADRAYGMIVYPREAATIVHAVTCGLAGTSDCATGSATPLASLTGGRVRSVSVGSLSDGFVVASVEETPGGGVVVPLRFVDRDGMEIAASETALLEPAFVADGELTADERVVAVELATTPSAAGVALVLAVLIRNEVSERDRVWLGGFFACAP